jgi:hypothetical protein
MALVRPYDYVASKHMFVYVRDMKSKHWHDHVYENYILLHIRTRMSQMRLRPSLSLY